MSHAETERAEYIQIIITSTQNLDNVIPIRIGSCFKYYQATRLLNELEPLGILGYHRPRVLHVRSGPNQPYSLNMIGNVSGMA